MPTSEMSVPAPFSIQKPEGYWVGELMVDSTLVSDMVAYHHWNGKVDPEWQRKAVNHILGMQLADGGWNIYHGGPAEVNATIKAYLALKLAGVIRRDALGAKVILSGKLDKKVSLKGIKVTKGARAAIEAAGGKIEIEEAQPAAD